MTLDDFKHKVTRSEIGSKIVRIRLKYSFETDWRYINELYLYDPESGLPHSEYVWENDWWEGEEDVEILGFINISDVKIPEEKGGNMNYMDAIELIDLKLEAGEKLTNMDVFKLLFGFEAEESSCMSSVDFDCTDMNCRDCKWHNWWNEVYIPHGGDI